MERNTTWVAFSFIGFGILLSVLVAKALSWLWFVIGLNDPELVAGSGLTLTSIVGFGLAVAVVAVAWKNPTVNTLAGEIVGEMKKVTWPTREETQVSTVVVIVFSIICGVYLGFFDAIWRWATDKLY